MGKYIKLFETHADYNTYITGSDKVLPNVSYCENENEVHYNPWTDPKLVCKYNITDTSSATPLRTEYEPNMFKSMEIDGVLLDNMVTSYQFDTTGEHTVKYELYDETKVGNNAPLFYNITTLTSVSIPNSVTTISQSAFGNCSGLTSITIPNSVTSIGQAAFTNCSGITRIKVDSGNTVYDSRNNCNAIIETATNTLITGCQNTVIPNSVTSIGQYAFSGCSGLTSITIPNSVTIIGQNAFLACSGLTSIKVDSSNTVYDSRNNCNAIIETATNTLITGCQNTVIPNSVTSIGQYAFSGCTGLTSITIPDSVTTISGYAFNGCTGLTSITIGNSVTSIDNYAFNGCTGLTSVTIPNSVTTIGSGAFQGCTGLTSITIGNSVTTIGQLTFYSCSGLTSITIPNSVTTIGNQAFYHCSGLTSITIGNSVTTIGTNVFNGCTSLTSITSLATTAPTIQSNTFRSVKTGGTLTVPTGSTGYDVWMGTGDYYLGKYNWTKVEQ